MNSYQMKHGTSDDVDVEFAERVELQEQREVLCRNCEHVVTSKSLAREPHEHSFRNPAGFSFHVVCYYDAPGALEAGVPTAEACWFPGYAWTYAGCGQCHNHIGWWYTGPDRFAGLIATRLIR